MDFNLEVTEELEVELSLGLTRNRAYDIKRLVQDETRKMRKEDGDVDVCMLMQRCAKEVFTLPEYTFLVYIIAFAAGEAQQKIAGASGNNQMDDAIRAFLKEANKIPGLEVQAHKVVKRNGKEVINEEILPDEEDTKKKVEEVDVEKTLRDLINRLGKNGPDQS